MTKFIDGPAAGQALLLRRSPILLRVAQDPTGSWDALDQLDDTPRAGETIHVYLLVNDSGSVHIRARKGSGCYRIAEYRYFPAQPSQASAKNTIAWREWCEKQEMFIYPEFHMMPLTEELKRSIDESLADGVSPASIRAAIAVGIRLGAGRDPVDVDASLVGVDAYLGLRQAEGSSVKL